MKAVKLTKIIWNLNDVEESKKDEIAMTLPSFKGFTVKDSFNVAENTPKILKKKYGYDILSFSFVEFHIAETVDELLEVCKTPSEKGKKLYKSGGKLSQVGENALENLRVWIRERLSLEFKGTKDEDMPKRLDEIMMGVENVSGVDWKGHTVDELVNPIVRKIWDKRAVNIKDEYDMKMERLGVANEDED